MLRYLHTAAVVLLLLVMSNAAMADQHLIIPQWNSYKSDFREATIEKGILTDSYNQQDGDTVNVVDVAIAHNYTLNIVLSVTNLHNNPYSRYGTYYRDSDGKIKRGKSVKRPTWGWVVGMKDMLNYNAVLFRSGESGDVLYSHSEIEMCIMSVCNGDTTYLSAWQKYAYDNRNNNSDSYNLWLRYKNNALMVGSGWNIEMPLATAHNVQLHGNRCGLYLSGGAKVRVDDAMIMVEEQDVPTLTSWNEELLSDYFSRNKLSEVEGFWEIILDSRRKEGVKMGGDYKLGIVANDGYYNIVYLSGAKIHPNQWKEGMVKGRMYPTISGSYKVEWYDAEREKLDNILAFTYGNDIKMEFIDENTMLYLTRTSDVPVSSPKGGMLGSGFAISSNGYIATNEHVINGAKEITVFQMHDLNNPQGYRAEVVACDSVNDIALLRIVDESFTTLGELPYSLSDRNIRKGEEIFYMGYPKPGILTPEIKAASGHITALNSYTPSCYMMSVDIDHGSSGSPVFDNEGNIIGIVVSTIDDEYTSIEANFAIKMPYLYQLIEKTGLTEQLPVTNKIKALSYPDKIEAIAPYVFFIICV